MQIEENKIFLFKFHTDTGELAIPVRANSQQEAAETLQKMLGRMQAEIASDFPRVQSARKQTAGDAGTNDFLPGGIPSEVLEMRLDTLLGDLSASGLTPSAKAQTVKNWTELDLVPENYPGIITALEEIKTGTRELPVPKVKKKP